MPVKGGVREFREVLKDGDEMAKIGEAFKSITGAPSLPIDLSVILDAEAQLQEDLLARKNHNLEELKQLIEDTKDIPLEKLIWSEQGCDIFDHLCLRMDINQAYAEALPQWKDVADLLEVDSLRTQWVQTCVRPKEGLTRAILEIYMKDGGTLGEVLEALYKLDCLQVLQEIQGKVLKYLEQKDKLVGMKTAQGSPAEKIDPRFFSILATLATAMGSGDPCAAIQKLSNGLCRAQTNLSKDALSQPISHDLIVQNSTIEVGNSDLPPLKMRTYDSDLHLKSSKAFDLKKKDGPEKVCRIMLLFAEDGLQYADQVYGMVQALEHKGIRAEVFRLNESSLWYELLIQPEACCMKWANEVDYVIPILTPNFLQHVHGVNHEGDDGSLLPTCPIVNRYMYTLLRARFVNLGCKNTIIRPVIPQEFVRTVGQATVIKNDPLFRLVWVPLAEDRVVGRAKAMLGEFAKKVEG